MGSTRIYSCIAKRVDSSQNRALHQQGMGMGNSSMGGSLNLNCFTIRSGHGYGSR